MPEPTDNEYALAAVVCGMPFSGTTLMSRIVCSHPLINSGFECGLLLATSPQTFERDAPRFFEWMTSKEPPHNWRLTDDQLADVCGSRDFYGSYRQIVEHCNLFSDNVPYMLDKTPAYVYNLRRIMQKVPQTPFVVIRKDPVFQYLSYKKRGLDLEHYLDRFNRQNQSLREATALPDLKRRILFVDFEQANRYKARTYRRVINFINASHPNVGFHRDQVPDLNSNLKDEIASRKKKLRPRYDYDESMRQAEVDITDLERRKIMAVAEDAAVRSMVGGP